MLVFEGVVSNLILYLLSFLLGSSLERGFSTRTIKVTYLISPKEHRRACRQRGNKGRSYQHCFSEGLGVGVVEW